ncbi:hypothetical protein [Martelella alba]|uniref:Uncharacterized protein n=1 Tax=Martelella alba TaxID=2590451 RepID=A0ABY2SD75_9HYPH|nr:hypothetical protein [Martelella alba]TKI02085.1 hypothetical protein FCN80_25830 [Martelella alba]
MELWPDFEEQLKCYQNSKLLIKQYIRKYEARCTELIKNIGAKNFDNCQEDFDELFDIQQRFATMLYKYDYQPEKKITDLIYHLDRDDVFSRQFWHKKFTGGQQWPTE